MTVEKLIAELSRFPKSAPVIIRDGLLEKYRDIKGIYRIDDRKHTKETPRCIEPVIEIKI